METKKITKSLRIKEFRGSTRDFSISFDPKKSLSLIYGENGTGKTTICDAFDFVGNAKVGSLENRGLGQLSQFWATVGKSNADILVELTVDGVEWKASASAKVITVTPDKGALKIEILRRASILKLVQDAPKDKYDAIKPFIDIAPVGLAEESLRKLIKDTRQSETDTSNRIAENRETLERLWQQAGSPKLDVIAWAKAEAEHPPSDHTEDVRALREAVRAIEAAALLKNEMVGSDVSISNAEDHLRKCKLDLEESENNAASSDAALFQILQSARDHFLLHSVGAICPLCESAEKIDGLAGRVNERLSKLKELEVARKAVQSAQVVIERNSQVLQSLQARVRLVASAAAEKIQHADADWRTGVGPLLVQLSQAEATGSAAGFDIPIFSAAVEAANAMCSSLEGKASSYNTIMVLYDQYQTNYIRQIQASGVLPKLNQVLTIFEAQRKKFLDEILSNISNEVGRLYEEIHPGEGLNKVSLKLDPKKTGSLDLGAEFLSKQDMPPHAYFSESHLDSLGLCIFLALAGRNVAEDTIIVMDDVLGSIDEPHVDRLIEMLYSESKRFKHTIVTTHYRPWREKFRWGWLKTGRCELIELSGWDPVTGIQTASLAQTPLLELRHHLAQSPVSMQSACASAGVLLEAICDYLVRLYECAVPLRKGRLTLGDLLPNIGGKLRKSLRIEIQQGDGSYLSVEIGEKLDQLQQIMQVRNVFGCHFNDLSQHLPPQDAIAFAAVVGEIGDALICSDEGWPGSDKSGSYWATRGETRRLHPLKKPS